MVAQERSGSPWKPPRFRGCSPAQADKQTENSQLIPHMAPNAEPSSNPFSPASGAVGKAVVREEEEEVELCRSGSLLIRFDQELANVAFSSFPSTLCASSPACPPSPLPFPFPYFRPAPSSEWFCGGVGPLQWRRGQAVLPGYFWTPGPHQEQRIWCKPVPAELHQHGGCHLLKSPRKHKTCPVVPPPGQELIRHLQPRGGGLEASSMRPRPI